MQTWIMRADIHPQEALINGDDVSVCWTCLHRGVQTGHRDCYVTMHTVGQVFKQFKAGAYPAALNRRDYLRAGAYGVRLGSYGDPAAVPWKAWKPLVDAAPWAVGYTQFPDRAPELRGVCMASANSLFEAERYQAAGWRTYRVLAAHETRTRQERICPASQHTTVCVACRKCNGAASDTASIAERVHGTRAMYFVNNRVSA